MPTPGQPTTHDGIGVVHDHTGETVVRFRRHTRRKAIVAWLHALIEMHPDETVAVAWDQANTHQEADVEAVGRGAAGRLASRYRPTDCPWLNPIARLWRHVRREGTRGELFACVQAWLTTAQDVFVRYTRQSQRVRHPPFRPRNVLASALLSLMIM